MDPLIALRKTCSDGHRRRDASALTAASLVFSLLGLVAGVQHATASETVDGEGTETTVPTTVALSSPEAVAPTGPDLGSPTTVPEPDVRGETEVNPMPEMLAVTGRTTYALVGLGVLLLCLGGSTRILSDRIRRRQDFAI
ncbi:MAG: hypothetical protein P8J50_02540 [Acidimicrobiales bacterium]|nr:hypothetical protein [Acidimicrobiales bacterium]